MCWRLRATDGRCRGDGNRVDDAGGSAPQVDSEPSTAAACKPAQLPAQDTFGMALRLTRHGRRGRGSGRRERGSEERGSEDGQNVGPRLYVRCTVPVHIAVWWSPSHGPLRFCLFATGAAASALGRSMRRMPAMPLASFTPSMRLFRPLLLPPLLLTPSSSHALPAV